MKNKPYKDLDWKCPQCSHVNYIEQKPKLFSKEWKQWFMLRFKQNLYVELEKERQRILKNLYEVMLQNGYEYRKVSNRKLLK